MRVGIDFSLVPGERTGGGQYAYQLARALPRVDPLVSYVLYPVFYYIVHPEYQRLDVPGAANVRMAFRQLAPKELQSAWRPEAPAYFKEVLLGASQDPQARDALRQFFRTTGFYEPDPATQASLESLRRGARDVREALE